MKIIFTILFMIMFIPHSAMSRDLYEGDDFNYKHGTVIIETDERVLFFVLGNGKAYGWPIAVGRDGKQWFGKTKVIGKTTFPTWHPTDNMRIENPRLPKVVLPGKQNPLGTRAIYLGVDLLRIHGTNNPSSIGKAASHGCFRMKNHDVEDLFEMVEDGTTVIVR